MLYRIAQEHGNTSFSWENLEREVESKAGISKGSLNGKLQQLEAPLVASKRVYNKVLVAERIKDSSFDKMVDKIPMIKSLHSQLTQPSNNLDTTYAQAGIVKDAMGGRLKDRWGDAAIIPDLKDREDAERKIKDKYFGKKNKIKDIFRCTLKFSSFKGVFDGWKFLEDMKGIEILNVKNKFKNPDVLGYADININAGFKLQDDTYHIFEIQLHLNAILVAKEEVHDLYNTIRVEIPKIIPGLTVEKTNQIKEHILGRLRNSMMDGIIDILFEKSGGVFLFARLLEEKLKQDASNNPGSKLDFINLEAQPEGLDGIYRENMERVCAEGASDDFRSKCFQFISLICAAQEPLPQKMVQNIMGDDAFRRVKGKLSLLFPTGADGRIIIIHKSLIDWLLRKVDDGVGNNSGIFEYFVSRSDLNKAHGELYEICR
eukprot:CAMPEP_0171293928 /NCGR_PEP_ID=MMETSP0816-20121228/2302_1 /TAXON_ID=420281 /ORGANISM="Proboscia inermis, Strain CCAP1064/1" /LENGTH=429 /DNA_ID=CAMNT_0011765271 /DNA_START=103 /DNA_END=1389 /DNA_ORIENTATION=+